MMGNAINNIITCFIAEKFYSVDIANMAKLNTIPAVKIRAVLTTYASNYAHKYDGNIDSPRVNIIIKM